jgi:D-aminopeptidase
MARLRDLGIQIGTLPPGPLNAITDVPGVLVGESTLIRDTPSIARTGVTAIYPRADVHQDPALAAVYSFNGIGEMTGLPLIQETGMLSTPILFTSTKQVGLVYDTVVRYGTRKLGSFYYMLPVVAETYDAWLNDIDSFPLTPANVIEALESASSGPVAEGNTGGGTGMIGYEFKGGTGTASRQVIVGETIYTVGALVQVNHGDREHFMVDGVPVGREIGADVVPLPQEDTPKSSILAAVATDAPLLPNECKRLAQRATIGLARTGGFGLVASGDIFIAFSTGNHYTRQHVDLVPIQFVPHFSMNSLIVGTAEAVEEAILNALVAAETMTGFQGHTVYALPHDLLQETMRRWNRANKSPEMG